MSKESLPNYIESLEAEERPVIGQTKDGATVRDRVDSHFHSEGGLTAELLAEALSTIDTKGRPIIAEQVDFDQPVGRQTCVMVGPEDDIEMVFRKKRSGRTPMVHGREAQETNSIVVVISRDGEIPDNNYKLVTSYVGEKSPREPWDPGLESDRAVAESEQFWNTHALLYDESLIDFERTEKYKNMTDEEREVELMREKVLYAGIFLEPESLYSKAPATLARRITQPHITTGFRPGAEQLHLGQLGSSAKIIAVGYGNDGKNEGLLVQIEAEDPEIQAACDALEKPHITLSIAKGAAAKNTANLEFAPLDEPIELTGRYGLFVHGKVIDNYDELKD